MNIFGQYMSLLLGREDSGIYETKIQFDTKNKGEN